MIVVDASIVAVALADDGADGRLVRARIREEELLAPHLLDLEVLSVLRGRLRGGHLTPKRAAQALQDLADLPVERVSHETLLPRIWELRENYTPYDAAYIALAELFRTSFVTADQRAARGSGARCEFEVLALSTS